MRSIDLNCDLGESFGAWSMGDDFAVLAHVSSINIACGFHAGDPQTMRRTVAQAVKLGVAIGAHPGLPDKVGFGRRELAISPADLYADTLYQIGALAAFVHAAGAQLRHVKAHGALYHMLEKQPALCDAFLAASKDFHPKIKVFGLSGGNLVRCAEKLGIGCAHEVFADRQYESDRSLTPRHIEGAVHRSSDRQCQQLTQILQFNQVRTRQGQDIDIKADTVCLHGDSPNAAISAKALREAIEAAGFEIAASHNELGKP